MKTALQWLDERGFHYKDKGVWESDIEAIQNDARAELLTELEVARELIADADKILLTMTIPEWMKRRKEFLSTFKNHEA